jgi:hypothetical protein
MNFIEACNELAAGACESIKRKRWMGSGLIINPSGELAFENGAYLPMPIDFAATDYELVNPKPVMETVEVKIWRVYNPGGSWQSAKTKETAEELASERPGTRIVELTGVDYVPLPAKVKRREELRFTESARADAFYKAGIDFNGPVKYYAEWQE